MQKTPKKQLDVRLTGGMAVKERKSRKRTIGVMMVVIFRSKL